MCVHVHAHMYMHTLHSYACVCARACVFIKLNSAKMPKEPISVVICGGGKETFTV